MARNSRSGQRIGVISDTHGLLRPAAVEALKDSDLILHAGDIGCAEVLAGLREIAPVIAVRGNIDLGAWADTLPEREIIKTEAISIYMLHDVKELDADPAESGCRVIISGHSHKPAVEERGGVFIINPGSAGPRRFRLPISVVRLNVRGAELEAKVIELAV